MFIKKRFARYEHGPFNHANYCMHAELKIYIRGSLTTSFVQGIYDVHGYMDIHVIRGISAEKPTLHPSPNV